MPGSLYLLAVPAQLCSDEHYPDVLGRWLDYLQAGAPEAVVQAVLTHCDELLPEGAKDKSTSALEEACELQVRGGALRAGRRELGSFFTSGARK